MTVRGRVDGMRGPNVAGWAMPETGRRHCRITVKDERGVLVAQGQASQPRADLEILGLGRTDLAFCLRLPAAFEDRSFQVFADGAALPGSPLRTGPGRYDGGCAAVGGIVTGWVAERVTPLTTPSISIVTQHNFVVGQGQSGGNADASRPRAEFCIELPDSCFGAGELRLLVLADGVPFCETSCALSLQGSIDVITPEHCAGWLIAPDAPRRRLEIEVFRDGAAVAIAGCTIRRWDIHESYPGNNAGFSVNFPASDAMETTPSRISLRLRGSPVELFGGPYLVAGKAAAVIAAQRATRMLQSWPGPGKGPGQPGLDAAETAVLRLALAQYLAAARTGSGLVAKLHAGPVERSLETRVTVIIPVYRNIAATSRCIDAVLAHRNAATDRVLLIDDASPEPGMAATLEGFLPQPNVFLLRNEENVGFVKTVNRGIGFAGLGMAGGGGAGGDVLLLNADTVVSAGALDELHAVANAAVAIGTVTALSNNATIFSYPAQDLHGEQLADADWPELARTALAANAGMAVEVPTAHGFCMWIKAGVLQNTGLFDEDFGRGYCEENDFCARASDLGYRHVAAAGVLVQHCESLSFGQEKHALLAQNLIRLEKKYPEYLPKLREFERLDGLRAGRWALDNWRLRRARQGGAQFVLVICNSLGGGSAKAATDIEQAVGYAGKTRLSLNCRNDGSMVLFAGSPVFRASFTPGETTELFALLDAASPTDILVHQLLGFSEKFIRRLEAWLPGRNSVYYLHDFYALCPRVTLIDANGRFCDLAATQICQRCVGAGGSHDASRLQTLDPAAHRALFQRVLQGVSKIIAPSPSAAGYLQRGFPGLRAEIVAHPESGIHSGAAAVRKVRDAEEIVLFGALGPHKGSAKLLEIACCARLTHPGLVFRVIGYTDIDEDLLAVGNVIISGSYTADTLPVLVAQAQGELALFLHEWPETYSYTLSEALRYGFVPLVPDIGAPPERLRAMGLGLVYPFPADARQVLRLIDDVISKRTGRLENGARPDAEHPGRIPDAEHRGRKLVENPATLDIR